MRNRSRTIRRTRTDDLCAGGWVLLLGVAVSFLLRPTAPLAQRMAGPPAAPMTIPLPEPLFWDPAQATGDYAVVEQTEGIFLLRPSTGRVIARLRPLRVGGARPLEVDLDSGVRARKQRLPSPDGWPFRPGDEVTTTPVAGDLDGDGTTEVVFATRTGWVWALGRDGLPLAGWPVSLGADCHSSPALADLDRNGRPDILLGDAQGRVHALRLDGRPLPGWPAKIPGSPAIPEIYGAVVAGDLDGDGRIELVVTQAEGRVCAFRSNGRLVEGWPVAIAAAEDPPNAGTIFARVAIGDLTGDGRLEIVAAANNYRVHLWDATGRPVRGWPRPLDNRGRAGYGEPALADLTGDGRPEILVVTDRGFAAPARIYAFDATGAHARGWPVDLPERCNAGVAVGDLDGDGSPEVVAGTMGETGWVLVWNRRGRPIPGFPIGLAGMSINASPLVTDVDGDGEVDILFGSSGTTFEPAAILFALDRRGGPISSFPLRIDGCEVISSGPCVADIDGDGLNELLMGTEVQGQLLAYDLAGLAGPEHSPWPRPGFNEANTGLYSDRPAARTEPPRRDREAGEPPIQGPPFDNPFSPLISVSFVLLEEGPTRLTVLDVHGNPIRTLLDSILPVGAYTISWDGTDGGGAVYPPGVYFYELESPGRRATGQLLLVR